SAERRSELERAVSALQGNSGVFVRWRTTGPLFEAVAVPLAEKVTTRAASEDASAVPTADWRTAFAAGLESRVVVAGESGPRPGRRSGRSCLAGRDRFDRTGSDTGAVSGFERGQTARLAQRPAPLPARRRTRLSARFRPLRWRARAGSQSPRRSRDRRARSREVPPELTCE